jgi:hypothetical protein
MKVFCTVLAEVARVPELPLLVVVDDVFVLVHAADPVEAAAAKVADVRPDLVVRVTDVKLLLENILLLEAALDFGKRLGVVNCVKLVFVLLKEF